MNHRPSLTRLPPRVGPWLLVAGLALAVAAPAGAQTRTRPAVTAAVQVTQNPDPTRAHSSPQIAVNPKNGELVIVEADVRGSRTCNVHISVDDGRSWSPGGDPMMAPYTNCSLQATNGVYATLQFDADAILYMALIGSDPKEGVRLNRNDVPRHIFFARSTDGGRTFRTTRAFEAKEGDPGVGASRRPMIALDPSEPANIYIGWQKGGTSSVKQKSMLSVSHDRGRTWAEPLDLSDERGATQPRPAVGPDGVVHAIFTAGTFSPTPAPSGAPQPVRPLLYRRSTDRGKSWSDQKEIDAGNAGFSFGRKAVLAADPNSSALYASWYGNPNPQATRPSPVPPGAPPPAAEGTFDDRDVYVRTSRDAGRTWSSAVVVNDDADRPDIQHYDPAVSIAPNGRIDVGWYDFRNSPVPEWEATGGNAGGYQDVYYASSTDGGRTFTPNVRVTDRIIDRNIGVWSNNVHAHTNIGIASTEDSVYFAWQDARNGSPEMQAEDVYFAALKLGGPRAAMGAESGVPRWWMIAAAALLGMGLAVTIAAAAGRRPSREAPGPEDLHEHEPTTNDPTLRSN